jgi:hypothetical protein
VRGARAEAVRTDDGCTDDACIDRAATGAYDAPARTSSGHWPALRARPGILRMGPPALLLILALVLVAGGLVLFLRAAWRLQVVARARFTFGAPYSKGQNTDRVLGLLMTLPLAPAGVVLLWLALAQGAFQPTRPDAGVRVGRLDAHRAGWGRTAVSLAPDPLYPERRLLEGEVEGARWAVSGDFLDWAPGVRWLGLVPAHRVGALVGTGDPSGTAPTARLVVIDAPPSAARLLLRWSRFVPFLRVRRGASPWFVPAGRSVGTLYATSEGYLADAASTSDGGL